VKSTQDPQPARTSFRDLQGCPADRKDGISSQTAPDGDSQATVDEFFGSSPVAGFWDDIYREATLDGRIYQDRKAIVLKLIEELHLPGAARVLEIGCGAGHTTFALASQGYQITAVDSVPVMLEVTRKRLAGSDAAAKVSLVRADVRRLPMPDDSFDLAFAIGVLPWVDQHAAAAREIVRVVRPGGYVLLSADNNPYLGEALDPRRTPLLGPLRRFVASGLRAAGLIPTGTSETRSPKIYRHSRREFEAMLSHAGLRKVDGVMVGFGPFTLLGRNLLSDSAGMKVHRVLQAAATRKLPIVSSYGMQYLVMATKPHTSEINRASQRPGRTRADSAGA